MQRFPINGGAVSEVVAEWVDDGYRGRLIQPSGVRSKFYRDIHPLEGEIQHDGLWPCLQGAFSCQDPEACDNELLLVSTTGFVVVGKSSTYISSHVFASGHLVAKVDYGDDCMSQIVDCKTRKVILKDVLVQELDWNYACGHGGQLEYSRSGESESRTINQTPCDSKITSHLSNWGNTKSVRNRFHCLTCKIDVFVPATF